MNWQRARTEDKKNERKEAIYEAAFTLFKKKGYENVSFNGIAVEAGFTKSNMYRYFSSREEIFLNIFSVLFEKWVADCLKQLGKLKVNENVEQFSKIYVKTLKRHSEFLDLTPLMFISLEKNSSYEQLIEFKRLAKNLLYGITLEISRIFPEIKNERAFKFLNLSHAATTNYWAGTMQNDSLRKVYKLEEFKELKPNFEKDLTSAIEIIVHGLKAMEN